MSTKARKGGNPYAVLYWMGAALVVLIAGVIALAMLRPKAAPPDPERTLLWLYDPQNPSGSAVAAVIEESPSQQVLRLVGFPAPAALVQLQAIEGGRAGRLIQEQLAGALNRQIHHRVFLPHGVVTQLIDAAGGIAVHGRDLSGAGAVAWLQEDPQDQPRRAALIMLALAEAATTRGVNMGVREGLALAGQIDTDLDLLAIPDVLARWSQYPAPAVEAVPAGADLSPVQERLLPDPAGSR